MKILFAYVRQLAQGDSYEEVNIAPTLIRLGHDCKFFNIVNQNINISEEGEIKPIDISFLKTVELFKPNLVIFLIYKNTLSPIALKYLTEKTNATTLMISGDDEKYFAKSCTYSPHVDYILTTYRPAVKWHKCLNKNVIFAPYHANDRLFRPLKIKRIIDSSYCGLRNDYRVNFLNRIAMSGIKLKVYGNGWCKDSALTTLDYVRLINSTKVNIAISIDSVNGKEHLQVKGRDFEIPMSGGFLLTHYNSELKPLYKFGEEIETYKNIDECIDKAKYYITHDKKREKIALAGCKRARKEHTSICRWRQILKQVKLKK